MGLDRSLSRRAQTDQPDFPERVWFVEHYLSYPDAMAPFSRWSQPISIPEWLDLELAERLRFFWMVKGKWWLGGIRVWGDVAFLTHPELNRGSAARIVDLWEAEVGNDIRADERSRGVTPGWTAQAIRFQIDPQFGPPLFEYGLVVSPIVPGDPDIELLRDLDRFAAEKSRRGEL